MTNIAKQNIISKDLAINLASIGISIVIFIILWVFTINPKIVTINKLQTKINSILKVDENQIKDLNKKELELLNTKNSIENKVKMLEENLLKKKNISTMLDIITMVAKNIK